MLGLEVVLGKEWGRKKIVWVIMYGFFSVRMWVGGTAVGVRSENRSCEVGR